MEKDKKKPTKDPKVPPKQNGKVAVGGDVIDKVDVNPTTKTEENASLLGRLRRAIGENKDPHSRKPGTRTNLPLPEKKSLRKPPRPEGTLTPRPVPQTENPFAQRSKPYKNPVANPFRKQEVELGEARRKSAASLRFIRPNVSHGVTASSEPYGDKHLPVVTTSSGSRVELPHILYHTPELAQQGAQTFIDHTYTKQGTDPIPGFQALIKHHQAHKNLKEEVELDEISMETAFRAATAARKDNPKTAPADPAKKQDAYYKHLKRTRQEKTFADYGKRKLAQASNIPEEVEPTNEAVLTLSQRLKRAQIMRREEPKLKRSRELTRNRFARDSQLKNRAEKLAKQTIRKRFAGERGYDYAKLSPTEKMGIDAIIDKKVKLVKALAKRLYPVVKRKEAERFAKLHADIAMKTPGQPAKVNLVNSFDPSLDEHIVKVKGGYRLVSKKTGRNLGTYPSKEGAENREREVQYFKHANEEIIGLRKKADKTGIDYSVLEQVYNRGIESYKHNDRLTEEQWAFGRVNSFIAGGKVDSDLQNLNEWYIDTANKYKPSRGDSIVTNNGGRVFGRVERVDEVSVYFRSQNDNRVYKTEINNVSKVDHWDGTLNEDHMPSCSTTVAPKPMIDLSKRIKKILKEEPKTKTAREQGITKRIWKMIGNVLTAVTTTVQVPASTQDLVKASRPAKIIPSIAPKGEY